MSLTKQMPASDLAGMPSLARTALKAQALDSDTAHMPSLENIRPTDFEDVNLDPEDPQAREQALGIINENEVTHSGERSSGAGMASGLPPCHALPAISVDCPSPCRTTSFTSGTAADAIRAGFKQPSNWMLVFGNILACCAGIVNAVAIRELSTMVSNMTGNSSRIGLRLEGVHNSGLATHIQLSESVLIVLSFIGGAFLCGLLVDKNQLQFGGKAWYGAALVGNSFLLCVAAMVSKAVAPYPAAMALGLQNAMCTSHFGAVVRTTHVTGSVTDIGSTLGRITMMHIRPRLRGEELTTVEQAEVDVDCKKLRVLVPIVVSFVFGCYQGGFLEMWLGQRALFVPASVTGAIGIIYTCFRQRLKQYLKQLKKTGMADPDLVVVEDDEVPRSCASETAPTEVV